MSALIFFVVLVVLVLVHEWGHFITAKKTGMRVDEFGFGFPPKLFGIKKRETEYSFNLLPIGGFVRIFGEDTTQEGRVATGENKRSFSAKPKWAQALVLVAGIVMNILLAWVLFVAALSFGVQSTVSEETRGEDARLVVAGVLEDSPADLAGIGTGVEITALEAENGDILQDLSPTTFRTFAESHSESDLYLTYTKGEIEETVTIRAERGLIEGEETRSAIGVSLALLEVVSLPLHEAIVEGARMTVVGLRDIVVGISALIVDAVQFNADFSSVAGPVGIVGLVGEASSFGFTSLLLFTAFISLNLAVINLLPFPALDGGRLLFVCIEAIKGTPIRSSWVGMLNTVGFALLIAIMAAVTYNDIARIL